MLAQRKGDVLEDVHGVEERAALKQHPELFPHAVQLFLGMIGDVFILDDDAAAVRRFQSEHVPQRDRLAAPRSAEDDQDFAAVDLEIGAAQHLLVSVRFVDVAELDEEIARMPPSVRRLARLGAAVGSDGRFSHQKMKRKTFVRKKSRINTVIDAVTTVAVVERPTPSAPPVVLRPL